MTGLTIELTKCLGRKWSAVGWSMLVVMLVLVMVVTCSAVCRMGTPCEWRVGYQCDHAVGGLLVIWVLAEGVPCTLGEWRVTLGDGLATHRELLCTLRESPC